MKIFFNSYVPTWAFVLFLCFQSISDYFREQGNMFTSYTFIILGIVMIYNYTLTLNAEWH